MPPPEELARENIDKQPEACGQMVKSRPEMNLYVARSIAVHEYTLAIGETDYLLLVDGKFQAAVEVGLVRAARLKHIVPFRGGGAAVSV